jgi:hypothetical protein
VNDTTSKNSAHLLFKPQTGINKADQIHEGIVNVTQQTTIPHKILPPSPQNYYTDYDQHDFDMGPVTVDSIAGNGNIETPDGFINEMHLKQRTDFSLEQSLQFNIKQICTPTTNMI